MNVAIVGYGTEGEDSAKYWSDLGHKITICDRDESIDVPSFYLKKLGKNHLKDLDEFDVVVRSAGINPDIILESSPNIQDKITSNIQEFFRVSPTKNIIGVTGTKGKGTTSTLISKMLNEAGFKAHLFGNIGLPPLGQIKNIKPDDWVVLELSSFQLTDFKGPSPHIAVCLMMVPEHLNWHKDMDEYVESKANLFRFQTSDDYAIFFNDNNISKKIATSGKANTIGYFGDKGAHIKGDYIKIEEVKVCKINEIKLLGRHNQENVCAAITAVWQITPDVEAIKTVVSTFSGLEHRLEFVRDLNEVSFFDDSFATTPETAIAAIRSFEQPKILILGGSDKGISLEPLAEEVAKSNVKHVVAIGDMAPIISSMLNERGFTNITLGLTKMDDIVAECRKVSSKGDVVLLSTGCASFGLFQDYKDRGNKFKQSVLELS